MATPQSRPHPYPTSPSGTTFPPSHRLAPPSTFAPLDFLDLGPDASPGQYLNSNARSPAFDHQSQASSSTTSYPPVPYPAHLTPGGRVYASSNHSAAASPVSTSHSRRGSVDSHRSASRRPRKSQNPQRGDYSDMSMEIDGTGEQGGQGQGHGQGQGQAQAGQNGLAPLQTQFDLRDLEAMYSANGSAPNSALDLSGALQQLEGIHMQSPGYLNAANGGMGENTSFQQMAAMYLTSPHMPSPAPPADDNGEPKWRNAGVGGGVAGMITPGPSGEMMPQARIDQMSPMQLEFLAKMHGMEGLDMNNAPLLSPALTNNAPSAYTSPANSAAFHAQNAYASPLEALQDQQRQFQEQLLLLQYQQRQIQATAAAVAATTSPFLPTSGNSSQPSSGQTRPVTTPGTNGPGSSYFSPLTSPALEATRHQYHHYSPAFNGGHGSSRPPHPLSALSSPALNPVGVSGGAQQTLSPALQPQDNTDIADPDYIRALVGMFENDSTSPLHSNPNYTGGSSGSASYQSPHIGGGTASTGASPLSGPHRSSLPPKSRPSPMMKPTHRRQPSSNATFSLPSSPAAFTTKFSHLGPPASNGNGNGGIQMTQIHPAPPHPPGSTTSTPSPVDLSQIMPPPPVPGGSKGMTPMTPASLMNLGAGSRSAPGSLGPIIAMNMEHFEAGPSNLPPMPLDEVAPRRPASIKPSPATPMHGSQANGGGASRSRKPAPPPAGAAGGTKKGNRTAPLGKQRLAARVGPSGGGVGVRAATKGSAMAASYALPEGENRKTSHKAAEQKRRDSLKAGFDELRLLLPPINTEALDPETGEPVPGSSAPRLLPKSSLVPDDNPNRGVSKVALLRFSNEYIGKLHERVDKRDNYISRLRDEVARLRGDGDGPAITGDEGEDLLEIDITEGEDEYDEGEEGGEEGMYADEGEEDDEGEEEDDMMDEKAVSRIKRGTASRPGLGRNGSQGVRGR